MMRHEQSTITGGSVEVKASPFIDCSSSGRLMAASEVKCAGRRASARLKEAKELSSFHRDLSFSASVASWFM